MDFVAVLLIALGLAMDAFAVSICKGLAMKDPDLKSMLIVGAWFGIFQMIMPVFGYLLASSFVSMVVDVAPWISFGILVIIGVHLLFEAFNDNEIDDRIDFKMMFLLAIATSIDAFAIGITLMMENNIIIPALMIGIITFVLSVVGVKIGSLFGAKYSTYAEIAGGIILIGLGVKILLEYLHVF